MDSLPEAHEQQHLRDTDFDIGRTYMLLTATLILPLYLALSVVFFSVGALY